jgi:hypothetical protein
MTAAILILAEQPVVAALVGMLVELAGYQPVFAERGEQPTEAIGRIRPRVVILIDVALEDARSDLFFAQAAKRQLGVALFGPLKGAAELERLAAHRGVSWFTLPSETAEITRTIEAAASSEWWVRGIERRQPVQSDRAPEGALAFLDSAGNRWTVYDRRDGSGDRRGAAVDPGTPIPAEPVVVERLFVSKAGERFSCELQIGEVEDPTPAALEEQLSRARPV